MRPRGSQTIFCRLKEQRPNSRAPCPSLNVDCDDVPRCPGMHHDEPGNFAILIVRRYQCEQSLVANIKLKFPLRIRDTRREAFLVHAPECLKILRFEVANDE